MQRKRGGMRLARWRLQSDIWSLVLDDVKNCFLAVGITLPAEGRKKRGSKESLTWELFSLVTPWEHPLEGKRETLGAMFT